MKSFWTSAGSCYFSMTRESGGPVRQTEFQMVLGIRVRILSQKVYRGKG